MKMMTFFQTTLSDRLNSSMPPQHKSESSPPGRKPSAMSETESDTTSLTSSEDFSPHKEGGSTPYNEEEKKKKKGMRKMLDVFTKGIRRKSHPSSAAEVPEMEVKPDAPPPTVEELYSALKQGRLEMAHHLLPLERALGQDTTGMNEEDLICQQSKVEALYTLLREAVLHVVRRPLENEPGLLLQALNIILEQEQEDQRVAAEVREPPVLANTRPRCWLKLWQESVKDSVEERMTRPSSTTLDGARPEGMEAGSEAAQSFLHMGKTMKEDLLAVAQHLQPLYPAQFNVFRTYAKCYHNYFSAQLNSMVQFELNEQDTSLLLLWVQNLYPNEIINNPKLSGELQRADLGSLLPPKEICKLEVNFLSNEAANVQELMLRGLQLEVKRWSKDKEPMNLEGHFHSELPIDIIQIIAGAQVKAENISMALGKQIKPLLLAKLSSFLKSYHRAFADFVEKNKQQTHYRATIMANINNCLTFRTHIDKDSKALEKEPCGYIFHPLCEIEQSSFNILLQDLFVELKPLFKRLTQTRWAAHEETVAEIIKITRNCLPEFKALRKRYQEDIMEAIHLFLVKEYIIRLSKKRLVLRTADLQLNLAQQIMMDAKNIQCFCAQNESPATWLEPALPTLAEIIRLQDTSAIKIEVATFASHFPDFSKGHLGAILTIKGNLSNSEIKGIKSILDVSTSLTDSSKSLFSLIKDPPRSHEMVHSRRGVNQGWTKTLLSLTLIPSRLGAAC
ncbi:tumor necrosis factor alpha-induced protein 2 [Dromiciops gliroides]|uniref:tumor necrosis factor alpha-induced protein 2 n=1 Tax=Dromiciops gliroides TaxID=33562 RepID=UPI001CC67DE7|nr:tumor necrosis factor alpha-induced protein 2 [Dromiciops gliroides]